MKIGDKVTFMYGGLERIGRVIGSTETKIFIRFYYKMTQIKEIWLHKSVCTLIKPKRGNTWDGFRQET